MIKTRLQVARKPGDPVYRGIVDCFQHIVKNEGPAALFKGVVPRSLIVAVSRPIMQIQTGSLILWVWQDTNHPLLLFVPFLSDLAHVCDCIGCV